MTWEDFERMLCFMVVRASHERPLSRILQLWRDEFAKQYEARWLWVPSVRYAPSIGHLPPDHPLLAPFRVSL